MTEKVDSPDVAAAKELADQIGNVANSFSTGDMAASAFLQSQLSNVVLGVVIKLLVNKQVVTEEDFARRLTEAYKARKKAFNNESVIVAPPLPTVRN